MKWVMVSFIALFLLVGCSPMEDGETNVVVENSEQALFAGGCFWCIEAAFQDVDGVLDAVSGYTGGDVENPTYKQVSSGITGHRESVLITFDPSQVTYEDLLDLFWRQINPTDAGGQFADRGEEYTTAIYYFNEEQKVKAQTSKNAVEEKLGETVVTEILPAQPFYEAEEYHQDYYQKRTVQYQAYKTESGRKGVLASIWGDK